MLCQELISPHIKPLETNDTVAKAILLMEELDVQHLPVVSEGHFLGLLSESDLLDANETQKIEELKYQLLPFSVTAEQHFYNAAKMLAGNNLSLVPVNATEGDYLGCIVAEVLLRKAIQQLGVMEGGAVVVLQIDPVHYSIGELSKLVETNDAQITQLNTSIDEQSGHMLATLRINKQEVSDVIATFQRYDYQVVYFAGEEHYENELRRNYNHLMNFLTM